MGCRRYGCYWQISQGTRPVVLILNYLEHPHQQRMRKNAVGVHRAFAAHPGPVPQAAFRHANIPWPTFGITPLRRLGGEPNGKKWPDCCGFVVLPESQSPIRPGIMSNGYISISRGASADAMFLLRTRSRAGGLCCTSRSERFVSHWCS